MSEDSNMSQFLELSQYQRMQKNLQCKQTTFLRL